MAWKWLEKLEIEWKPAVVLSKWGNHLLIDWSIDLLIYLFIYLFIYIFIYYKPQLHQIYFAYSARTSFRDTSFNFEFERIERFRFRYFIGY